MYAIKKTIWHFCGIDKEEKIYSVYTDYDNACDAMRYIINKNIQHKDYWISNDGVSSFSVFNNKGGREYDFEIVMLDVNKK